MTVWGREQFNANKPSKPYADDSRKVPPAQGNDPLGNCDPLGYPRNLGTFEILQTPTKIVTGISGGSQDPGNLDGWPKAS